MPQLVGQSRRNVITSDNSGRYIEGAVRSNAFGRFVRRE
jgi:hypothetical protein